MTPAINKIKVPGDEQLDQPVNGIVDATTDPLVTALNIPEEISNKENLGPVKDKKEESTREHLLNKPNMTAKDKEGMQKTIDLLVANKMDTQENLKKLDAINYAHDHIEIGWVKRAREDIKTKPIEKLIFQHEDTSYFMRSEEMIKEQNALLAKQGMEIPSEGTYEKSMQALPGTYKKWSRYTGGNILSLITDMSMSGFCDRSGGLYDADGLYGGYYGARWSASLDAHRGPISFSFGSRNEGKLHQHYGDFALPIRPVLK